MDEQSERKTSPGDVVQYQPGKAGTPPALDNLEHSGNATVLKKARFQGLIRSLRAEAQNLYTSIHDIRMKYSEHGKNACTVEKISTHKAIFEFNKKEIETLLGTIHQFLEDNPPFYAWSGDVVVHFGNKWERVIMIAPDLENPPDNICDVLEKCEKYLCEIVYLCDVVTVPDRVSEHLAQLKAGYALNFHDEFHDEFCLKEQEEEMLKFLARHPTCIDGLVDISQGLIFKVDRKSKRWQSYARIIGAVTVAGIITIAGVAMFKGQAIFPLLAFYTAMSQFFIPYTLIICGAVAHIIIGGIKEIQSSDSRPLKAVDDWMLWIHVKEVPILRGIAVICIGFAVLMAANAPTDYFTLFIAGYSIDSIGDLVVNKFDTVLTAKGDALKTSLSKE
ncbi:MAG: hypothetical protein LUQ66_03510 [Methanoregula sp.]|nr:hypothetical protein [Methanoregula sp.]